MSFCNPGMIPIILGISVTFAVVLCYIIAVTTGHVTPFMPFISEAGGNMPESGIFTMGLAIVVFVGGNFMFIRYKLVDELNRSLGNSRLQFFNRISLLAGFLCLLGLLTVAAYPISTISSVHGIGALIFFYVGIIYCFLQSIITYYLYPEFNGKTIFWIRIIISILSLLSAISMSVLGKIGNKKWSSASHVNDFILRRPDEKGFLFVTLSSGAEWLVALTFILFFFSYIKEFQKIAIDVSIYPLVSHFDFDPMPMTSERIKLRAGSQYLATYN